MGRGSQRLRGLGVEGGVMEGVLRSSTGFFSSYKTLETPPPHPKRNLRHLLPRNRVLPPSLPPTTPPHTH